MTRRSSRGVSLVELIAAVSLLALLGAAALRAMLTLARHSVAAAEHVATLGGVRTGLLLVQAELRELGGDAAGPDLVRFAADSVTYRATRGFGVTCAVSQVEVRVLDTPAAPFSALRSVAPGRDSLLLFVEGDSSTALDDRWLPLPVLSIAASTCSGAPALAIGTVDIPTLLPSGSLAEIELGGPVRSFEVMRLLEYASGGQRWLGSASVSGGDATQPVAGPLSGSGLRLEFLGSGGAPAASPALARGARVTLVGSSERAVGGAWTGRPIAPVVESLSAYVAFRNVAP